MISIAMALYNSTGFIREQFDSIRTQSVPVDEVVMIDDCSSDGTVEWAKTYIEKYNLKNWKLICHKENKGYIDTFYDALGECKGDIIILCDHDDVWYLDKVKIIRNVFNKKPEVLMLATSFTQIDENGNVIQIKQKRNHANNNLIRRKVNKGKLNMMTIYDVAVYNLSPGCTCAIRNTIKEKFLINKSVLPHDWTLSIIAACYGGLYYYDRPTTYYRVYEKNTIGLGHVSSYEKRLKIVLNNYKEKKAMLNLVNQFGTVNSIKYKYCNRVLNVFALRKIAMERKNIFVSLKAVLKSIGINKLYESAMMDLITLLKAYIWEKS